MSERGCGDARRDRAVVRMLAKQTLLVQEALLCVIPHDDPERPAREALRQTALRLLEQSR